MKLAIFSHCVIDSISIGESFYETAGGPACYASLTANNQKFDVELFTKFGNDFDYEKFLSNNKIKFENALSDKPTTRFKIEISDSNRALFLENICEPIEYTGTQADGFLVSPIFNEISAQTFERIKKDSNFFFLDPQGFLRRIDANKKIFLEKTDFDLSNISAIKVNPEEITSLVGNSDIDAMKVLQKKGVEHILYTNKRDISMLFRDRIYSLKLPDIKIYDTTGIGDIFGTTFCCTMLKEKDSLWAFCFAGGAAQVALESKQVGLEKVPKKGATETNASYFYNLIKFKQV